MAPTTMVKYNPLVSGTGTPKYGESSMEYSIWINGIFNMNGEWNADHNGDNKWNINGNASGKMHGIKLVDGDSYPYDSAWYEWNLNYWWWMEDEW